MKNNRRRWWGQHCNKAMISSVHLYRLNICDVLTHKRMALRGRASGKWMSLECDQGLYKNSPENSLDPSTTGRHGTKVPLGSQEGGLLVPLTGTSELKVSETSVWLKLLLVLFYYCSHNWENALRTLSQSKQDVCSFGFHGSVHLCANSVTPEEKSAWQKLPITSGYWWSTNGVDKCHCHCRSLFSQGPSVLFLDMGQKCSAPVLWNPVSICQMWLWSTWNMAKMIKNWFLSFATYK